MNKFPVIVADPPWTFTTYSDKGKEKSAETHYSTMDTFTLWNLPVEDLAADDSILLLWATWPNLLDAIQVGIAWGFEYKTLGFDWIKRTSTGKSLHMGLGYYTRSNSEPCLLFTKGHPKRISKGVHSVIESDDSVQTLEGFEDVLTSRILAHSAKPDEFYRRVERLICGPYLELFGRRERKDWTVLGNEVGEKLDIKVALERMINEPQRT